MTELIEVTGDMFNGGGDAIAHGCNMQGVMGAGVARVVRDMYPRMYDTYRRKCQRKVFKLGDVWYWDAEPAVFNLMTQDQPGPDARLSAVTTSVRKMLFRAGVEGIKSIDMPRIGCGIGGLEWVDVRETLVRVLEDTRTDVELRVFTL